MVPGCHSNSVASTGASTNQKTFAGWYVKENSNQQWLGIINAIKDKMLKVNNHTFILHS